jgi:hypothetical protein
VIALAPMPEGWPRGWWLARSTLWCIHPGSHCYAGRGRKRGVGRRRDTGARIPAGDAIFLTGEPGEVYCAAHAPAEPPP